MKNKKVNRKKVCQIFLKAQTELRKKIAENTKSRFSKPVLQFTLKGEFIKDYPSARDAAKYLGIAHSNLINCFSVNRGTSMSFCSMVNQKQQVVTFKKKDK